MIKNGFFLKYLIGQSVKNIDFDINTVLSLKQKKDDQSDETMSVYTQVYFNEYRLDIYNKTEITGGTNISIKDLIGLKIIDVNETNESAELIFENGYRFTIDLRDDAYGSDPEAMCLYGPNNLIVVWN